MIKYNINQKTRYGKGLKLASIDEWVREFMIYVLRQESNCSAISLRWDDNEEEEENDEVDGVSFVLDQHVFFFFLVLVVWSDRGSIPRSTILEAST
jgi:hypothetical protein